MAKTRISLLLIASLMLGSSIVAGLASQNVTLARAFQRTETMEAQNKASVESTLQAWMAGDGEALQSLLSDDIEWTISGHSASAGTTRGRAELMTKVLRPFGARFSQSSDQFKPRKIYGLFSDGDKVVAHFLGGGTTNKGRYYENSYVWLLTMHAGKVVHATAFFDSIAFNELWQQTPPALS